MLYLYPMKEDTSEKQKSVDSRLQEYQSQWQRELVVYRRQDILWSWIRLAVAVVGGIIVFLCRHQGWWALGAGLAVIVIFVLTVARHGLWRSRREKTQAALTVIDESFHQAIATGQPVRRWQRPADPTSPDMKLSPMFAEGLVWELTDQEREDLDLYNPPVGLFGLLNRCSTEQGARRLRDMLDHPFLDIDSIRQRQEAIDWLSRSTESRLRVMASALPLRGHSEHLDALVQGINSAQVNPRPLASKILRLWSCVSGSGFIYMVFQLFMGRLDWVGPLLLLSAFNSFLMAMFKGVFTFLRGAVVPFIPLRYTFSCLLSHSQGAAQELPTEAIQTAFHAVVHQTKTSALREWLDWASLGGMPRGLLNLIVFFDLHLGEAILKRLVPYRDILLQGLAALAELEALNSLACFAAEHPNMTFPEFKSDTSLKIQDGRHPLIHSTEAVPNSLELNTDTRTWVITGPNAAGKSTFVRMVGMNVLLAQVGSAVLARAMTLSPLRLITDVRVRDDLAKHESYFLSEVRRLRRIVTDRDTTTPLLGLIDEPFRGTNSPERVAAGVSLLEHLLKSHNLFFLATHEEQLALTAERSPVANNVHFQERLHVQGVEFDYKLHPGSASTRTAIRILEQEHYPVSLLERARELMQGGAKGS